MNPALVIYRVGNYFHRKRMRNIASFFTYINRFLFAVWIPSSVKVDKNFKLGYGGLGVVIHSNTIIGNNSQINQNVTIGRNFNDTNVPKIGNDVYIGTGSVIFGEITIGNNVIVGANSVVNKNVPPNTTIAGNPFRIIKKNRKEKYYDYK